jgi:hypothetical protein
VDRLLVENPFPCALSQWSRHFSPQQHHMMNEYASILFIRKDLWEHKEFCGHWRQINRFPLEVAVTRPWPQNFLDSWLVPIVVYGVRLSIHRTWMRIVEAFPRLPFHCCLDNYISRVYKLKRMHPKHNFPP